MAIGVFGERDNSSAQKQICLMGRDELELIIFKTDQATTPALSAADLVGHALSFSLEITGKYIRID